MPILYAVVLVNTETHNNDFEAAFAALQGDTNSKSYFSSTRNLNAYLSETRNIKLQPKQRQLVVTLLLQHYDRTNVQESGIYQQWPLKLQGLVTIPELPKANLDKQMKDITKDKIISVYNFSEKEQEVILENVPLMVAIMSKQTKTIIPDAVIWTLTRLMTDLGQANEYEEKHANALKVATGNQEVSARILVPFFRQVSEKYVDFYKQEREILRMTLDKIVRENPEQVPELLEFATESLEGFEQRIAQYIKQRELSDITKEARFKNGVASEYQNMLEDKIAVRKNLDLYAKQQQSPSLGYK